MTSEEYNEWSGVLGRNLPTSYIDSGGSVNDPYSLYGKGPEESTLKWSSGSPNDILYGHGGMWSPLTEDVLLNDPAALNSFNAQLTEPGMARSAYTKFNEGMSDETKAAIAALSGSSHSLGEPELGALAKPLPGSEALNKMWASPAPPKA